MAKRSKKKKKVLKKNPIERLINSHATGIIIKEMIRRASVEIYRQRISFVAKGKINKHKKGEDFLTTADLAAQKIYVNMIKENFPNFGIIAEESDLSKPCRILNHDIYFTVDPLDGTKAYIRKQSHAITTMISLVFDGEVIAAGIGEIMTGEIYYYRPSSNKVHRLSDLNKGERLEIPKSQVLKKGNILLKEDPRYSFPLIQDLTMKSSENGLFKGIEISGGSTGAFMARLWKGEVVAVILDPIGETPWDSTPIIGISQKLGFEHYYIDKNNNMKRVKPKLTKKTISRDFFELIIHKNHRKSIEAWYKNWRKNRAKK